MAFRVALTFDAEHPDRPADDGNAARLLDALAAAGVRATFFVQGRWAEAYPAVARRIGRRRATSSAATPSITPGCRCSRPPGSRPTCGDAEAAILEHVGVDPRPWFRCPFGAGGDDPQLVARIEALGYREVGWDVSAEDWEPTNSTDVVAAKVIDGVTAHGDGAVVLQHTWPNQTLGAIPAIVATLRERGATFVAVDELGSLPTQHAE